MRYKYTRKEIAKKLKAKRYKNLAQSICNDLLATKESRTAYNLPDRTNWKDSFDKLTPPQPKKIIRIGIDKIHSNEKMVEYISHLTIIDKINELIKAVNDLQKK